MADYKGRTRTPYTNALEAEKKAQEAALIVQPAVDIAEQVESVEVTPEVTAEQPKKRGRPFKAKGQ